MLRDVVITGVGLRTPMGHTLEAVQAVFESGVPVIRSMEAPAGRSRAGATMDDDFGEGMGRLDLMFLDPVAQMLRAASDDLMTDSGLTPGAEPIEGFNKDRVGVLIGSAQGANETRYEGFKKQALQGITQSFSLLRGLDNGAANQLAMRHKLRGACETSMSGCISSTAAIGQAARMIRHGYLDAAVAGGAEATFNEGAIRAWEASGTLAVFDPEQPQTSSRPFSADRSGMVLGEGVVIFMLEAREHALARGARIYATLAGYGSSSGATHLAQLDADGQALAIEACLRDAGLATSDVGYINADACGSVDGDAVEVQALRKVFGPQTAQIAISSTKSLHGHWLGAAGAAGLLAALGAVRDGVIPPTANLDTPDPAFADLDLVAGACRRGAPVRAALVNSFSMGGSNACLVLTA